MVWSETIMIKMQNFINQSIVVSTQPTSQNVAEAKDSHKDNTIANDSQNVLAMRTNSEKNFYFKRLSLPYEKGPEPARTNNQNPPIMTSFEKQNLANNLLIHLKTGSIDSLNIMKGIFDYHRYDTKLLDRYIKSKTPENLRALTIQIEKNLFI
jgi:hypothetical protein